MEQETPAQTNARIEQSLFKTFGGEDPAPAPTEQRKRNHDGTFVGEEQQQEPAPQEAQGAEATEQEPTQAQPEETEVEIEGEKYMMPKKIADRFIQHADYTRKTQDIAELRRVTLAERETANLEKAFSQTTAPERQQMALLDAQIAQYQGVNWAAIEDTGQLIKMREQLNQLKDMRAGVDASIKAKRTDFDEKIKGMTQEAMAAGLKYIQQHIKGYDEKLQRQLHDYGRAEGYTQDELSKIIDPRIVVTLWKASQWDALKASQPGITKRAASAAPVVRPGATQKTVSRVGQLNKAFKDAKSPKDKKAAAEDYFAARFGGG